MSEEKTKKCKHCKMDIPKDAKICPHCRKKQKSGILKWVVLILIIGVVIGAVTGEDKSADSTTKQTEATAPDSQKQESESIEYTSVSVNDMMDALNNNAMGASDKYKGKYLEITGKLTNIDAAGKYIDLMADGDFEIIGVQCYIKNDDQKAKIASMSKGDTVTLKGKCTDVGEVLGYSLDIDEIE
jgi:RNA polymerase subunit RPABC4/transcription elongation factor Spt4